MNDDIDRRRLRRAEDRRLSHIETELNTMNTILVRHDGQLDDLQKKTGKTYDAIWGVEGQGGLIRSIDNLAESVDKIRWWAIGAVFTLTATIIGAIIAVITQIH